MKKYIEILKKTRLFAGISEEDILGMLPCLDAKLKEYKKGEYVLRQGERLSYVTILVEGEIHIQNDDYWGNRTIVNSICTGEMFGESYAAPEGEALLNDAVAIEDCAVLFLDVKKLMTVCSTACRFHSMVVQNLMLAISEKNRRLVQKLAHVSKRTTREKLISYLSEEAKRKNSASFSIPFDRQQLADFLYVERSAMSNELCKLRDEGLLEFRKNHFTLLQKAERI